MDRIQLAYHTFLFRESNLFRVARARLQETFKGRKDFRVLSFGCSVGDELASIRWFFPEAIIVGCDANPLMVEESKKSAGTFSTVVSSDKGSVTANGPYDLIIAASVLCLNPRPADFMQRFPPSKFDDALYFLDSVLSHQGILAITNASYRFHDSPVARGYDLIRSELVGSASIVDVMDRAGQPFLVSKRICAGAFFCKGPAFMPVNDEELMDCLFQKNGHSTPSAHWVNLDPIPTGFICENVFERNAAAGTAEKLPDKAIDVISRIRFGRDSATGARLALLQARWKSVMHDGEHIRPEYLLHLPP